MKTKEYIQKSNSQALQDIFALYSNQFSTNGYFVDLGCNEPIKFNNTALLESIGWSGFLVDYMPFLVEQCKNIRKNPVVQANLIEKDITELLDNFNSPKIIDYLSLDLDYGAAWDCIKKWNFNKYKIKSLTFEHDYYDGGIELRNNSRDFLTKNGLLLICSNVTIYGGKSFEDWYVDPTLVPKEIYEPIICDNTEYNNIFTKI